MTVMKSRSVFDLVKNIVVQIDAEGVIVPANKRARSLLESVPEGSSALLSLFGTDDPSSLFERAREGVAMTVDTTTREGIFPLRWELIAPPSSPDTLIGFTADWEPVQDMVQQVRTESLMFRELVLNILPHRVAESLVLKKGVRPKAYRACTVLFTDVVSFSRLAFHLDPVSLIRKLNTYFSLFDELMEVYGIEKIKTIGDAYMCASGLPDKKPSHAVDCALAALALLDAVADNLEEPHLVDGLDLNNWQMRVGMHSGPCISGVVGSKKFVFDIWGDSVNIAARMESASEANGINISAATWQELSDFFVGTHRGSQHVKNIGEVEMYFLERLEPAFSANDKGTEPNAAFWAAYCKRFRLGPKTRDIDIYPEAAQEYVMRHLS